MKYTKEELDSFKNDPLMQLVANLFSMDLNDLVENAKKELEQNEKIDKINKELKSEFEKCSKQIHNSNDIKSKLEETLCKMKKDGVIDNFHVDKQSNPTQKKEYNAPECQTRQFLMSKEQFVKFIDRYIELINNFAKLRYLFGISLDNSDCKYNVADAVRGIIWSFVRLIFGDDNADVIADFVYGNSNFDSAEYLYDELV